MDFIDRLKALSASAHDRVPHTVTEEASKTALVLPFLQVLGYNVFDPREVVPEYVADVGTKRGEKVDYAVMQDGDPAIIIECKAVGAGLDIRKVTQLFRYFASTPARFGILTDGMDYKFFSDLEEPNRMDTKPFMEFDLSEITTEDARNLRRFTKESFSLEDSLRAAENLKYTRAIKFLLNDLMRRPDREFVRYVIDRVHGGVKTQALVEKFTGITRQALREFINDKISARLQTALEGEDEPEAAPPTAEDPPETVEDEPKPRSEIITTAEETRGHEIVQEILSGILDPERVVLSDQMKYCNILLDGAKTKNIVRMYFNGWNKNIRVYDEAGTLVRYPVESAEDVFRHAEPIRDRVRRMLA